MPKIKANKCLQIGTIVKFPRDKKYGIPRGRVIGSGKSRAKIEMYNKLALPSSMLGLILVIEDKDFEIVKTGHTFWVKCLGEHKECIRIMNLVL